MLMASFWPSRCQRSRLLKCSSRSTFWCGIWRHPRDSRVISSSVNVSPCMRTIIVETAQRCQRDSACHLIGQPEQGADVRAELHGLAGFDVKLGGQSPLVIHFFKSAIIGDVLFAERPHATGNFTVFRPIEPAAADRLV